MARPDLPKVGVLLSGCGFLDGAEIHEAVFALLVLNRHEAEIICCAPNIAQAATVDHATGEPAGGMRNVLAEAARIARGDIRDVAGVSADELDALILPGGFGAAKNLCDFAERGAQCDIVPEVEKLVGDMLAQRKPIGAICIAPALLGRVATKRGLEPRLTIGNDPGTAAMLREMGCVHEERGVTEIAIDEQNKLVTTPAYMLGPGPAAVFEGVRKLVEQVLRMI